MTDAAGLWCVVQTRVNQEEKAAFNLRRQGFEIYLPRYLKIRRHARKTDTVARPLFPRYLFVMLNPKLNTWASINSTFGVSSLVYSGTSPATLEAGVIDAIRSEEADNGYVDLKPLHSIKIGSKVEVIEGAFSHCLGLFEGFTDLDRVAILLDMLGRKVRVILNTASVEPVR